jgi:hypothetical protein
MATISMVDSFGTSASNGYGSLVFKTNQTETGVGNVNREALRINHLGNIGIGTSEPTNTLHVSSNMKIDGIIVQSYNTAPGAGTKSNNILYSDCNDGFLKMMMPNSKSFTLGPFFSNQHKYMFVEDNSPVSVIGTAPTTRLTYTTPFLEAGTYKLSYSASASASINNRQITITVTLDGVNISSIVNMGVSTSGSIYIAYDMTNFVIRTDGIHTLVIQFTGNSDLSSFTMSRVSLEMFRLF